MVPLIAVGLAPGKLLHPFSEDINIGWIIRFHQYLREQEGLGRIVFGSDSYDSMQASLNASEVEVIGMWGNLAVSYAVLEALKLGQTVHSPKQYVEFNDRITLDEAVASWHGLPEYRSVRYIVREQAERYKFIAE
jgi:hypothetical protein